ncbi:hypothetical protein [Chryseobacterium sp. Marseille-Q8038]
MSDFIIYPMLFSTAFRLSMTIIIAQNHFLDPEKLLVSQLISYALQPTK